MNAPRSNLDAHRSRRRALVVAGVAVVYALPWVTISGTAGIFLKLGDISGGSQDPAHPGEIVIKSFVWGVANHPVFDEKGLTSKGPREFAHLQLVHSRLDLSPPEILVALAAGTPIPRAVLTVQETKSGNFDDFIKFELEEVYVSNHWFAKDSSSVEPDVVTTLAYKRVQETYFLYEDNVLGGTSEFFWDLAANVGGSSPPTISEISDTSTDEDEAVLVNFTVGDSDDAAGALVLARGSTNQVLLPTANIVFGGAGTNREATLTPAPNQNGSTTVTIMVTDSEGLTASESFVLTVHPVNDAPTISSVSPQATNQDVPIDVDVTVGDIDSPVNGITVTGSAAPGGVVGSIADISGTGPVRTIRISPAGSGTATVTLTAADNGNPVESAETAFSFTANAATGPNEITLNGSSASVAVSLPENSQTDTSLGVLDAVDGPGVTHSFTLPDDAGGRFKIGGASGDELLVADGSLLDFEDLASHTVMVQATDTGDPSRTRTDTFTIDLSNLNEPALISAPAAFPDAAPDSDSVLAGMSIADPDAGGAPIEFTAGAANGILTIDDSGVLAGTVTGNGTAALIVLAPQADLNAVLAAGGLVYRSDITFGGTETVTFATDDQGHTGPGGPQGANASATIEVVLTPWEQWRRMHFNAAQLADPAVSGFSADADGDGLPNGGEYGVNADPHNPADGPGRITPEIVTSGADEFLAVRFLRRTSDPDFSIEVQLATDLANFGSGNSVEHSSTPVDPDFEDVTVRSTIPKAAQNKQQIRLHFSLNAP